MRVFSILIPKYQPPTHFGATPVEYQRKIILKFERALMDRSTLITKQQVERLSPDTAPGGGQIYKPTLVYRARLDLDADALGELVVLALELFALKTVTVEHDEEALDFTAEDAEEFLTGVHTWRVE